MTWNRPASSTVRDRTPLAESPTFPSTRGITRATWQRLSTPLRTTSNLVRTLRTNAKLLTAIAGNTLLWAIGSRVGIPGVNREPVTTLFENAGQTLLPLYNLFTSGSTSRVAILALGALPYLQARLLIWTAGLVAAQVTGKPARSASTTAALSLTGAIAIVQSFGFVQFLLSIPGAVSDPGSAFVVRTVLLMSCAALSLGWLSEQIIEVASGKRD